MIEVECLSRSFTDKKRGVVNAVDRVSFAVAPGEIFERLGMGGFADSRFDKLSSGMKQKAAIAGTLIHNPPVLIFDEPTATVDVVTAGIVEGFILEAKREGKCIIYSTHIMEEAEYTNLSNCHLILSY